MIWKCPTMREMPSAPSSPQPYQHAPNRRELLRGGLNLGSLASHHPLVVRQDGKTRPDGTRVSMSSRLDSPIVIGATSDGGGGDSGDSGSGGESGGDDGGGEDDPPYSMQPSGGGQPRRNRFLAYFEQLFRLIQFLVLWPFQWLPDFVCTLKLFEYVFPDDIHEKLYAPGKRRLLRELSCCRSAEWDESLPKTIWKGFWRRVRFVTLVTKCFKIWIFGWPKDSPK